MESHRLYSSIIMSAANSMIAESTSWGRLCESIWRRASTSFVYTDIISPVLFVSKKRMGSDCILLNIALRVSARKDCVTIAIRRVYINAPITDIANTAPIMPINSNRLEKSACPPAATVLRMSSISLTTFSVISMLPTEPATLSTMPSRTNIMWTL